MVIAEFITWAQNLIVEFSYLAVFIVSLISTSTIFLPLPIYLMIFFAAGLGLNPFLVGISAGVGSAIGELTGYFIGAGSRRVLIIRRHKEKSKFVKKFTEFFKKYGFATIVVTSFLPFPFDIIGILSGVSNYDMKKFLIATIIGKTAKTLLIAYAGYYAIPYLELIIESSF